MDSLTKILVFGTLLFALIAAATILIFLIALKQKKMALEARQKAEIDHLNSINQTKIEIKDETLKYVAQELHDNIGQLLALSRIHLKTFLLENENSKIEETNNLLDKALDELRQLSKSLNSDVINQHSLSQLLIDLMGSINKTGTITASLVEEGIPQRFSDNEKLILYRIIQEAVSNAVKYAQCQNIRLSVQHIENETIFIFKDDGVGFKLNEVGNRSGIINMQHRAKLIGATLSLESKPNEGTHLIIRHKIIRTND